MAIKEIYLLRHGDTGRPGCYIGSTDVPLIEAGRRQAYKTGKILRSLVFDKVLCSPMLRCRETCEQLDLQIPYQANDLLKEVDFGRWEGKTFAEIIATDVEIVADWTNDSAHFSFPDGESLANFHKRVSAIFTMIKKDDHQRILLVTHGGVIRHLLCLCLGIPIEKYLVFDVQPGSYSSLLLYGSGGVLTGMNIRG